MVLKCREINHQRWENKYSWNPPSQYRGTHRCYIRSNFFKLYRNYFSIQLNRMESAHKLRIKHLIHIILFTKSKLIAATIRRHFTLWLFSQCLQICADVKKYIRVESNDCDVCQTIQITIHASDHLGEGTHYLKLHAGTTCTTPNAILWATFQQYFF